MDAYLRSINPPLIRTAARPQSATPPKRIVRGWAIVLWIFIGTLSLTISAMTIGKLTAQPMTIDPPPQYLPDHPIPIFSQDTHCAPPRFDIQVPCNFDYVGKTIVLKFHSENREIVHTTIWNYEYRVGDMIAAWGYPTGVLQRGKFAYLYWGTRAVIVYGTALHPNSFVAVIEYFTDPQQGLRWRGFTSKAY